MSCKICGRGSCTSSFHTIEVQEQFEKYFNKDHRELVSICIDYENEIENLKNEIEELNEEVEHLKSEGLRLNSLVKYE